MCIRTRTHTHTHTDRRTRTESWQHALLFRHATRGGVSDPLSTLVLLSAALGAGKHASLARYLAGGAPAPRILGQLIVCSFSQLHRGRAGSGVGLGEGVGLSVREEKLDSGPNRTLRGASHSTTAADLIVIPRWDRDSRLSRPAHYIPRCVSWAVTWRANLRVVEGRAGKRSGRRMAGSGRASGQQAGRRVGFAKNVSGARKCISLAVITWSPRDANPDSWSI